MSQEGKGLIHVTKKSKKKTESTCVVALTNFCPHLSANEVHTEPFKNPVKARI